MTIRTRYPKTAFMDILMTRLACLRFYALPVLKYLPNRQIQLMAFGAVDLLMGSPQLKFRLVMVKSPQEGMRLKGLLRMTLPTIIAQITHMDIVMTTVTITESYARKYLKCLAVAFLLAVTGHTINILMLAQQWEISLTVLKFSRRGKRFRRVALGTLIRQCPLMIIFMTGFTGLIQPQIGVRPLPQFGIADVIRLMTSPAIRLLVCARQWIPRQLMVKILLVKSHHVKIQAVMLTMTTGTVLIDNPRRGMVSRLSANERLYLLMAIQTFLIRYFFPQRMALRTVPHALQTRVRPG
jgi:hypothetical protein